MILEGSVCWYFTIIFSRCWNAVFALGSSGFLLREHRPARHHSSTRVLWRGDHRWQAQPAGGRQVQLQQVHGGRPGPGVLHDAAGHLPWWLEGGPTLPPGLLSQSCPYVGAVCSWEYRTSGYHVGTEDNFLNVLLALGFYAVTKHLPEEMHISQSL